jgi:multiple sugar transport system substrate-binding protein
MRRSLALLAAILAVLAISACGGSSSAPATAAKGGSVPKYDGKPVTITFWHPFTDRQAADMNGIIADFEKQYPNIKVVSKGGISDQNIIAAIRSGNPPDVAFSQSSDNLGEYCGTGAWIDLSPYIQADHLSVSAFPGAVQQYTQFNGDRCAVPDLADAYGLYFNKAMLAKAGITSPPKTFDELTADAKKLTVFNPDGSIKVAGFVPTSTYYENAIAHYAPLWNAHWDMNGKSAFALDPHWAAYLTWEKQLIDWYGVSKLTKFVSGAGNEFSPQNDFERGRVAMNMDGEWRVAFIKSDNAKIDYGTAPMPVDPAQPQLYGGGYTTGNVVGIPRDSKHKAAAWLLLKYLSFNKAAIEKFAEGLLNVPTLTSALTDPVLTGDPHFAVFLQIFANPNTATDPITAIGSANQTIAGNWQQKWEAGSVSNLTSGLQSVDSQINAQVANSTIGKAP